MPRRTCFVISPIGNPGGPAGKRADQVFKHVIKPVTRELSYRTKRADRMKRPGVITGKVLTAVAESELLIADLTDHSPSVFYALAIRHAAQRPVVQLIDAAQELPFDVANMRTIHVDIHDLDSAEAAREELKRHVRAVEADPTAVETPLLAARAMRSLRSSKEPSERFIIEALDELHALRQDRLRRDERDMLAHELPQAIGELGALARMPNVAPIAGAKVSTTGRPTTLDLDPGLFASTNGAETNDARDGEPAPAAGPPKASSRKSRAS